MFLDRFYSEENSTEIGDINITPEQASLFAKQIAGDFNPIHNPDSKRFCVPGDLLFSIVLSKYGLAQKMCFNFTGLVGKEVTLKFPTFDGQQLDISDDKGKVYLSVERDGEVSQNQSLIESLTKDYVAFSGHNYPHIMVPLMAQHQVMINPDRPLVIYEKMSLDFQHFECTDLQLQLSDTSLEVNGKRGVAFLHFDMLSKTGEKIGSGFKKLILSGLREYNEQAVTAMTHRYEDWKAEYQALPLE